MPIYVQALPFLLAAFAMPSSSTATTNTTVGGNTALRPRVLNTKNSKKQGSIPNMAETCTMERFLGKSHYINCKEKDTEVVIACDTTKTLCSYSEQPYPATSPAGCGDHGSFDPKTHLLRDPITGGCRLKFLSLINSCDAAPVVADDGFGVMVEAPLSRGTGPGSHNHELNEDDNQKDNSGLLLRFSRDGGVTYYNDGDLRETIPLNESSPRRSLGHFVHHREVDDSRCIVPNRCNEAICYDYLRKNNRPPDTGFFQNCWKVTHLEDDSNALFGLCFLGGCSYSYDYCWTNSHYRDGEWKKCRPKDHKSGDEWEPIEHGEGPNSCHYPCQEFQ